MHYYQTCVLVSSFCQTSGISDNLKLKPKMLGIVVVNLWQTTQRLEHAKPKGQNQLFLRGRMRADGFVEDWVRED